MKALVGIKFWLEVPITGNSTDFSANNEAFQAIQAAGLLENVGPFEVNDYEFDHDFVDVWEEE